MRCNNCGWDNSPNQIMCEKCSEALSAVSPSEQARPIAPPPPTGKAFLKGTIRGPTANKPFIDNPNVPPKKTLRMEEKTCPACQAPVRAEFTQCPYCQNPLGETPKVQDTIAEKPPQEKPIIKPKVNSTIRHWDKLGDSFTFSLRKINRSGKPEETSLEFTEDKVALNRGNLDPGNKTITSKLQATIEHRDGRWYLINNSELKSTFIQVPDNEQVELKDGVIILFGNSGFVFETK